MSNCTKMSVTVEAYQVIEKTVAKMSPSSGRVYLPRDWVGKKVKVFLMEEPGELKKSDKSEEPNNKPNEE